MTQQEILTQEIEGLDSLRFEKLCYILTDALSGKKLIHKGTDSRGQPRRSTVDSYSDDGTIVGEYSVDKNYFSDLSKPRGDINHALREHPQVNKIYLLSGVRMRPSEGKNITALCHEMQMCFQGDVFWYDAEELAKYILKDLLPKTEIVRRLSKFLPCLKSIYLSSPNTVSSLDKGKQKTNNIIGCQPYTKHRFQQNRSGVFVCVLDIVICSL